MTTLNAGKQVRTARFRVCVRPVSKKVKMREGIDGTAECDAGARDDAGLHDGVLLPREGSDAGEAGLVDELGPRGEQEEAEQARGDVERRNDPRGEVELHHDHAEHGAEQRAHRQRAQRHLLPPPGHHAPLEHALHRHPGIVVLVFLLRWSPPPRRHDLSGTVLFRSVPCSGRDVCVRVRVRGRRNTSGPRVSSVSHLQFLRAVRVTWSLTKALGDPLLSATVSRAPHAASTVTHLNFNRKLTHKQLEPKKKRSRSCIIVGTRMRWHAQRPIHERVQHRRVPRGQVVWSRALWAAAVGGDAGVAGTRVFVPGGARRNAVAPRTAGTARPLAQLLPRRQRAPRRARAPALCSPHFEDPVRHRLISLFYGKETEKIINVKTRRTCRWNSWEKEQDSPAPAQKQRAFH